MQTNQRIFKGVRSGIAIAAVVIILCGSSGCGSFKGFGFGNFGKPSEPEFHEVYVDDNGFRVRKDEESKENEDCFAEAIPQNANTTSRGKEKSSWFNSGDSSFLMSSQAKEIHGRLERKY